MGLTIGVAARGREPLLGRSGSAMTGRAMTGSTMTGSAMTGSAMTGDAIQEPYDVVAVGETMAALVTEPPGPLTTGVRMLLDAGGAESNVAGVPGAGQPARCLGEPGRRRCSGHDDQGPGRGRWRGRLAREH
jgi:hypothetical protein